MALVSLIILLDRLFTMLLAVVVVKTVVKTATTYGQLDRPAESVVGEKDLITQAVILGLVCHSTSGQLLEMDKPILVVVVVAEATVGPRQVMVDLEL